MDWRTLVDKLADVERAPQKRLQSDQNKLQQTNNSYGSIKTQLTTLQARITTLKDSSLFESRSAQSSDATVATVTAAAGAPVGSYSFNIQQLATAGFQRGASDIGAGLSATDDVSGLVLSGAGFSTAVTAGSITVNGKQITVSTSDTLQDVFNNIFVATDGDVTGTYDSSTDKISLTGTGEVVLGSATDTSNFLAMSRLQNNGLGTVTSASMLGGVRTSASLASSNLATAISDGGSGAGEFKINGVALSFNSSTDTIGTVLARINNSAAGVTASYDSINDRFQLASKTTGDVGIALEDVSGNFLAATGLAGGTLQHGKNLLYSVNGGGQLVSQSNTITDVTSGITGLSVTALKENSTVTLSVGADTAKLKAAIQDFLSEYNKAQSVIDNQTASTTDSKGKVTAGTLANDRDVSEIASGLRVSAFNPAAGFSGTIKSLADLGIVANGKDNTFKLDDESKLDAALANNLADVSALFGDATNGVATKLGNFLDLTIGDDGTLIARQDRLSKQSKAIDSQIPDLERVVQDNRQRLINQFVAMETAQSQSNQQLAYLQKQFP